MRIVVYEVDTGENLIFPMNPEEIQVKAATRFQSYDIMNKGEVKLPLGEELTGFSWSGKLPGRARRNDPFVISWTDPKAIQGLWSEWRSKGTLLVLYASDTPINHDVYLEDYNVTYSGGNGDYDYDISFVVAKPLIVKTEDTKEKETSTGVANNKTEPRPSVIAKTYVVKTGDSLWAIAEAELGSGERLKDIATLNNIENPDKIYPGQELKMPEV